MTTGTGMRGIVTGCGAGITTGRLTGMTGRIGIGLGGATRAIGIDMTRRAIGRAVRTGTRPMRSIVIVV